MKAGRIIGTRFLIADPQNDLLGRGGMGDVYCAADTQTGETVAVNAWTDLRGLEDLGGL